MVCATKTCDSCGTISPLTFSPEHCAHFCPTCAARELPTDRDQFDSIPWFTDQHAREAAERMKAWASGAGHVPQLAASVLSDAEWLNLARVALELRPR